MTVAGSLRTGKGKRIREQESKRERGRQGQTGADRGRQRKKERHIDRKQESTVVPGPWTYE